MNMSRQIHLDFHCSEKINDIGCNFDKRNFKNVLKNANVNSINLFAKCHHSWSYYPTLIGNMHPNLKFDLLGAQIKACKEIGITTNVYFAVGWSANDADTHPEWCSRNKDGSFIINGSEHEIGVNQYNEKLPNFYWKFMCLNNSYHDLICKQVKELCESYDIDGFWFDIYQAHRACYCENCLNEMQFRGIDIDDVNQVELFNASNIKKHCNLIKSLIKEDLPDANVFFNGTTAMEIGLNFRTLLYENNTIQDLEDLPTSWGGYDKLPIQSKFFINAGYSITAMSGKFHTEWGEFGGFKHPEALKYEAATMVAFGANCNFGDQLHPNGLMDISTYQNIGYAFNYVKEIESYGKRGKPFSRLGLWRSFNKECDEGISKILLENHQDFDVANFSQDFSEYSTIIFPSKTLLDDLEIAKVERYLKSGGRAVVLEKSILNFLKSEISNDFGIKYLGESCFDCDYTKIHECLYPTFIKTPFLNYIPAIKVEAFPDTEVLAEIYEPYFNRTLEHYCSHQQTPYRESKSDHPAITKNRNCIFVAHPLDFIYQKYGARIHRDLFNSCLDLIYKNPVIHVELPSAARINLLHQINEKRYALHLLYSTPMLRGSSLVIEDCVPLNKIKVSFDFPEKIKAISLFPDNKNLDIKLNKNENFVVVPQFKTHCVLLFHYY